VRNLLFYHPSKPLPLSREVKTRKTRTKTRTRENEGRCCCWKISRPVILSLTPSVATCYKCPFCAGASGAES
jgi:hypothetical protein